MRADEDERSKPEDSLALQVVVSAWRLPNQWGPAGGHVLDLGVPISCQDAKSARSNARQKQKRLRTRTAPSPAGHSALLQGLRGCREWRSLYLPWMAALPYGALEWYVHVQSLITS